MLAIKTILHPTDFSEASMYALDLACELAVDYGANLVIMHVVAAPLDEADVLPFPNADSGRAGLRNRLDHLEISEDGINVTRRIEEGNPAVEILNMADMCHVDLIVMGSHRRHGVRRLFMGSVADVVMRQATCPVLTVTTQLASNGRGRRLGLARPAHL